MITKAKDWSFTNKKKCCPKGQGHLFDSRVHIHADTLFESIMDYYSGSVLKEELESLFLNAGFGPNTIGYRYKKRQGMLEFDKGRVTKLKGYLRMPYG